MIRVLHFASIINRYDFIDNIIRYADPGRFRVGVCVCSPHSNIAAPVYSDDTPRWVLGTQSRWRIPWAAQRLACILRRWKADVLHTHHYDEAVIGWLATRLCPSVRLVVGRHYSNAIYRSSHGMKRRALLGLEQVVNRSAARIVVPSTYIRQILTQRQGIDPDKVDLVPYGFVAERYDVPSSHVRRVREDLKLDGQFVLGSFGRLDAEKGQQYLIRAVSQLRSRIPRLHLLLVGEGPERGALQRQIQTAGLGDSVHLLGWRRDAMALMATVDAVVQPTMQEAFSQVMVEALWMRKPLIITDVSGAVDIIRDSDNGLLVPKGDVAALATGIERLSDNRLRTRLAAAGRKYVEEHLAIDKIIPRYEEAYLRTMES